MSTNMQQCWDWLHDRSNLASVVIDYERGGAYRQHRVTWHVANFGWVDATGQSFEEAVMNAINTRIDFETLEHFPPAME